MTTREIKANPPEEPKAVTVREEHLQVLAQWSGPVPPPSILERYESIVPGSGNRILTMAENQAAHRIDIEKSGLPIIASRTLNGQKYGFSIAVLVLVMSAALVLTGHDTAGTIWAAIDIVGLTSAFITGTVGERRHRASRWKAVTAPKDE